MSPKLTRAEVLRVAALARLELTDAEVDLFTEQLTAILGYASEVQQIDTTGVSPAVMTSAGVSWRPDEPAPSLDRDDVLPHAPDADRASGLFKVPKVL